MLDLLMTVFDGETWPHIAGVFAGTLIFELIRRWRRRRRTTRNLGRIGGGKAGRSIRRHQARKRLVAMKRRKR